MYDINTKHVKKGYSFFSIALIVGLLLLIILGSRVLINIIKLKSLDSQTISTRVLIDSYEDEESIMYSPTYFFNVDGKEYACPYDGASNKYPETDPIPVYYDSKNPAKCISEYTILTDRILVLFLILPISFIVLAIYKIINIHKRIKKINNLNQKGKLIKNIPYRLEDTGMVKLNKPVQRLVIDFISSSGRPITLYGDPRYDNRLFDSDGMVDLVIDENNPENYFIDFEINRLTGNQPSDYYENELQIKNEK